MSFCDRWFPFSAILNSIAMNDDTLSDWMTGYAMGPFLRLSIAVCAYSDNESAYIVVRRI
jgi:hypothetical protein